MISLRHHVISLAAVFLALAVGVVLGSGLLSDSLLSGVRAEKKDLRSQISELNDEKNALNEKLDAVNDFDALVAGRIVRDALAGKSVVIFRAPDADSDDVESITRTLGQSGATVTGTVSLTQEFVDANSAEKLRSVVTSSVLPAGAQLNPALIDQGSQAGDLLGIAVLINRDKAVKPADDAQRETVLAALRDTGFISYGDQRIGAADAALVLTGGAVADDAGNQGASVARLAAALAPRGAGTLLAGRDGSASGSAAVAVTRADAGMAAAVSTVDDIDTEAGRITTVLGLAELVGGGHPGQYGIGPGATAVTVAQ
ncbi:copper transporter [Mycobacterium koreense]|uniref:Channel-forming protein n=1 Tax=Mycolicibacillus koreensis TaxID=1069220 RepID=A0A7I7S9C1_9MYCO|nr:copper transporter [Mycolicibacillus koreensis]MCV7246716.1 copper transporter [Mycolicibacillus koreensis]ODR04341.1 channel-forming protein [Mycolicibacillus koreensis]OSC28150.1 channel-forming protein [Mycolicibacillus koreensis]BBY52919.1 copper transporter MctB [Mycolicibacillus koreensis]